MMPFFRYVSYLHNSRFKDLMLLEMDYAWYTICFCHGLVALHESDRSEPQR